jgi:uncharacterized protein (TIGR02246 family)
MHKLTLMTLAAAALIAGSMTRTVSAQAPAAIRAAIDSGNAQYIRGFAAADAGQVAAVYAPDGGRMGDGGHVARGATAIRADIDQLLRQAGPITVTLTTTGLWVIDDRAYESGKWVYAWAKKGGGTTTSEGRYVTAWGRQPDGHWRVLADVAVPE